jgi:hypothetical protein
MATRYLDIYLNDHLAGATAGHELAKRTLGSNRGNELERFLERLAKEIGEDRETLREIMKALGVGEDHLKKLAARAAERAGRFKLNGELLRYSPLSRVVELEALSLGVEGKAGVWRALRALDEPRLADFDFDALERRAARQLEGLEQRRVEAARLAFEDGR